jgi:hypothetical protein
MTVSGPDAASLATGMARATLQTDLLRRIAATGRGGLSMTHERWRVMHPLREKGLIHPVETPDGFMEHATLGAEVAALLEPQNNDERKGTADVH